MISHKIQVFALVAMKISSLFITASIEFTACTKAGQTFKFKYYIASRVFNVLFSANTSFEL